MNSTIHIYRPKMRSSWAGWFVCFSLLLAEVGAQAAGKLIRINLGTLAPRGSTYHLSLQAMGEKWRQASQGAVKLVIYPDGTQGGEADMVRLMRVKTLQAGLLTAVGLSDIEMAVIGLQSLPMMFRDLNEFDYVNERLRPQLEKRLLDKGFVVLFWVDAGWVRYFSKEPMRNPDDLKKRKIFVWAGNPQQVEIMKKSGYNPVPLETGEILLGLQTGLINTVTVPPIFALASQLDGQAPHMLELNWAPLVGAAVIKKEVWDRMPAEAKPELEKAAAEAGRQIQANSRKENADAVNAMKKRGLIVHPVSPELEAQWRLATEEVYPEIRGTLVPTDIFDEIKKLVQQHRSGSGERK